jgi:hypothetical protein
MDVQIGEKITLIWDGSEHEGPYSATVTVTEIDDVRKIITGVQ